SSTLTPRTSALRDSMYFCSLLSEGVSSTHGGHQVAQKFSTTTLPFRSLNLPGLPAISVGKSCAVLPATVGSPCRYIGCAKNTTTSAQSPTTPHATTFRGIPMEAILPHSSLSQEPRRQNSRSMHFRMLTSTPQNFTDGSGTFVGIATLAK